MRRGARGNITRLIQISIHAPLTGCDLLAYAVTKTPHISIHAPLTGCDLISGVQKAFALLFQSTHPLRDATLFNSQLEPCKDYFNPRTPYGMRLIISCFIIKFTLFQSTHPLRDATYSAFEISPLYCISIHAPLTGCDRR